MGAFCSCLRGKHPEEETVADAGVVDESLHLLSYSSQNRPNNAAENSESLPGPVTPGGPTSTNRIGLSNTKSSDEDVCPTCFEGYTDQNPKIIAKCKHHYHLGCIYDWMERSETCPACRQVIEFSETA